MDNETNDASIKKRDFVKLFLHQGALLHTTDHIIQFFFAENNNYHQVRIAYLKYEIIKRKMALRTAEGNHPIHAVLISLIMMKSH